MDKAGFKLEIQLTTYFIFSVGRGAAVDSCLSGFSKGFKNSTMTICRLCLPRYVSGCGALGL